MATNPQPAATANNITDLIFMCSPPFASCAPAKPHPPFRGTPFGPSDPIDGSVVISRFGTFRSVRPGPAQSSLSLVSSVTIRQDLQFMPVATRKFPMPNLPIVPARTRRQADAIFVRQK
jgi:hypothetical protein